jgi:hypothetical protein
MSTSTAPTNTNLLFKQYKIMVDSAERNSDRRATTHRFYTTIHTSLLTLLALVAGSSLLNNALTEQTVPLPLIGFSTQARVPIIVGVSLVGLLLCVLWRLHLQAYRRLNAAKFVVINEMEQMLSYPAFKKEWEVLEEKRHIQLTTLERFVPLVIGFLYFVAGVLILLTLLPK